MKIESMESVGTSGITRRLAGAAVACAAVLAVGGATASAQATAPTQTSAEASAAAYQCNYGAICVHGYKWVDGVKKYYWAQPYYSCINHGPWTKFHPTSYINNQTDGTVARFKDKDKRTIQKTGGAYSKGKVNSPGSTYYVQPC
ncbi:hypothetical protein [Streptomyces sp. NPDC057302]|uniref:hypothetical protein n=1 Tax=Streptomyces sp. NPDC057302 TaxID=3346094 RepID=UPI003634CA61